MDDLITAYSMVFATNTVNYAQAGYTLSLGGVGDPYIYGEFTYPGHCQPSGACTVLLYQTGDGDNYQYWENYNTISHQIYMYQGDGITESELANTPYDPTNSGNRTYWWGNTWYSQYMGENINDADSMPGTQSKKATFTSVYYQPSLDGGNEPPRTLTGLPSRIPVSYNGNRWCVQRITSYTAFNLWTNFSGCPSGTPS
jgi:hypothetical protein